MNLKKSLAVLLLTTVLFSCSKESTTGNTSTPPPNTVSYKYMNVTSIVITALPFKDASNNNWDYSEPVDNPAPDIYFTFNDAYASNFVVLSATTNWNVSSSQLPISYTVTPAFQVPNFYGNYTIMLYDDDSNLSLSSSHSGDDLMDTITNLSPSNLVSQGYPTSTVVTSTDGKFSITIGLAWHN